MGDWRPNTGHVLCCARARYRRAYLYWRPFAGIYCENCDAFILTCHPILAWIWRHIFDPIVGWHAYRIHLCDPVQVKVVNGVLDLVRHSGLNAIAQECHRLAVARGKYPSTWTYAEGAWQMIGECLEWLAELKLGNEVGAKREFGDILATVLSIGHHMGYDPEDELRATMQRNEERVRSGE